MVIAWINYFPYSEISIYPKFYFGCLIDPNFIFDFPSFFIYLIDQLTKKSLNLVLSYYYLQGYSKTENLCQNIKKKFLKKMRK